MSASTRRRLRIVSIDIFAKRELTFGHAVGNHRRRRPTLAGAVERLGERAIGELVSSLAGCLALLQPLVSGDALQVTVGGWFQLPVDAGRRLNRHLKVALGCVAARVRRVHRHVLKFADFDQRVWRLKNDFHGAGCVCGVDAVPRVVEVDGVTLLPIDQLDDVALRTAELRRSHICNKVA